MKIIKATGVILLGLALMGIVIPYPVMAEATKVRVSAHAAIEKGDVAAAQSDAQAEALQKAVEMVLTQIVPERTYDALEPLLESRILPQTERFISNYQIVSQDVSDRAYTVHLSVTVDTYLLRKNLVRIGVIKEPGSPPLAAVFVTVDAPLGLDHVKSLGTVAQKAVSEALDSATLVIIPPAGEDTGFRVIRPPQAPVALVSGGLVSLADLAIGVLFKKNGEAVVTGSTMTIPMYLTVQAVDVETGTLLDVAIQELEVSLGTRDGTLLSKGLEKTIDEMVSRMSGKLTERYLAGEAKRGSIDLVFEGRHDAVTVRHVLNEMQFRLGETTSIVPVSFSLDQSHYIIWTSKALDDAVRVLSMLERKLRPFKVEVHEGGITLTMTGEAVTTGVREFGEEVTFYRRLPVPGIENPDDIRKIEFVAWQEIEGNSESGSANDAPVGMGILGRVDPSRDLDFFRFKLPAEAKEVSVLVEQTGPGEVRSRVRVFAGGSLLEDQLAKSRGKALYFTFQVSPGMTDFQLSVEDFLGRYPSRFPYVLKVGIIANKKADEPT
ncbi:MAG: hypothetical protein RRA15_13580 [bacterium]|nr:hypothetical protein [bacterium]MDT8367490.1 hypothetical protein [bacterium]